MGAPIPKDCRPHGDQSWCLTVKSPPAIRLLIAAEPEPQLAPSTLIVTSAVPPLVPVNDPVLLTLSVELPDESAVSLR